MLSHLLVLWIKKIKIRNNDGKTKAAEVNFHGALISYQVKTGINFKKALCHSLSRVPLSDSHPDGTRRKTEIQFNKDTR